jgi:eukaryotic-like serine/threonine-protein kinase
MRFEPESYVSPHVRLKSLLKMSGAGSVWTAYHEGLDREVAVKFMSASLAGDPTTVTRWSRGAGLAAQLKSAHIVDVHEHGRTDEGIPYIVMDLLDGEDLSERLSRSGPLSLSETGTLVTQLCSALTEAHELGVVHRDINPGNVFLLRKGGRLFVKLLDFGVAKVLDADAVTGTGALLGTLVYMSPEQFRSAKRVDGRSDLWSVGVLAYQTLTGMYPFSDESAGSPFEALRSGRFLPPSRHRAELPPEVDAWFRKALCREPKERFQTAREMAASFQDAITREVTSTLRSTIGPPPHAVPPGSPPGAGSAGRSAARPQEGRRRSLAWALVLTGGALLVGAFLGYMGLSALRRFHEAGAQATASGATSTAAAASTPADAATDAGLGDAATSPTSAQAPGDTAGSGVNTR